MEQWLSDLRAVRSIARWNRLMGRRALRGSRTLRVFGILLGLIFGGAATIGTAAPLFAMAGGPRSDLDGYVVLISVGSGTFLLYLEIMIVYNTLFSENIQLFLTAPLTGRVVLMSRVYGLFRSTWLYALLGVPLVVVYGIVTRENAGYYILGAASLVAAVWMVTSLAVGIVLASLFALRRRISRDTLAVVSSVVAMLVFVAPRLIAPQGPQAVSALAGMARPVWGLLPVAWFGRSLVSYASSPFYAGLELLLNVALFLAVAAFSEKVAANALHDRLSRLDDVRSKRAGRRPRARFADQPGAADRRRASSRPRVALPFVSRGTMAVCTKDLLRIRRTGADLAAFLFPTAYLVFFGAQGLKGNGPQLASLIPFFVLILASTMGRVPISSFGMEQDQVWLYMMAPISPGDLVLGKAAYSSVLVLVWWEFMAALLLFLHAAFPVYLLAAAAGLWLVPGAVMLTLPFAIYGAAYKGRTIGTRQARNVYINRRSGWYIAVQIPYLLVQAAALGFAAAPFTPGVGFIARAVVSSPSVHLTVGILASLLVSGAGIAVGWSMSTEAWRTRAVLMLESGSLE